MINIFKNRNKKYWLEIEWQGVKLNAHISVPPYVSATLDQPEEGGIKDMDILELEFKQRNRTIVDVKEMLEGNNEIDELIIERYEKL